MCLYRFRNNNQYIKILGSKVNTLSMSQVIQEITLWCQGNEKHYICTADAYMLNMAFTDQKFQNILNNADIVTPDSSGTIIASKICKTPIKEKVSGCVLAENLCKISGENNLKIFFLGAKDTVVKAATKKMKEKYKNMIVAGYHHGYFNEEENQKRYPLFEGMHYVAISKIDGTKFNDYLNLSDAHVTHSLRDKIS